MAPASRRFTRLAARPSSGRAAPHPARRSPTPDREYRRLRRSARSATSGTTGRSSILLDVAASGTAAPVRGSRRELERLAPAPGTQARLRSFATRIRRFASGARRCSRRTRDLGESTLDRAHLGSESERPRRGRRDARHRAGPAVATAAARAARRHRVVRARARGACGRARRRSAGRADDREAARRPAAGGCAPRRRTRSAVIGSGGGAVAPRDADPRRPLRARTAPRRCCRTSASSTSSRSTIPAARSSSGSTRPAARLREAARARVDGYVRARVQAA